MSTSAITKLPPVVRSPTTLQYLEYLGNRSHDPYFKPRFTFRSEDRKHTFGLPEIRNTDPLMPPYPYGKNPHFKEANFGLYGGATLQSGNKISKGRNKGKTLRKWFPNVRIETLRSETLDKELKIPVTARVRRTIEKCGGLDQYVTGTKPARIKELGLLGWKLRWLVMTSPRWQERFAKQRTEHQLPEEFSLTSTFEAAWNNESIRAKFIEQQEEAWNDLREAAVRFERHVQKHWIENGEKEPYEIPKLETLQRRSPSTLELPERLARDQTREKRAAAKKANAEVQSNIEKEKEKMAADAE
ncbi:hypothetical protein ABEF93_002933 [Exophiala dermatitidis]